MGFSRARVTILEWPGVSDAGQTLRAAREDMARAEELLKAFEFAECQRLYRSVLAALSRIKKQATEFRLSQNLSAECRSMQRKTEDLEEVFPRIQRAAALTEDGLAKLAARELIPGLQTFAEAEAIYRGIDSADVRRFYNVDALVAQSQERRGRLGTALLDHASKLLAAAVGARKDADFGKAHTYLAAAKGYIAFQPTLLPEQHRGIHADIRESIQQEEPQIAAARFSICEKNVHALISEAVVLRKRGDFVGAKRTLANAEDETRSLETDLLTAAAAAARSELLRQIAAEENHAVVDETKRHAALISSLLDQCESQRARGDTTSAVTWLVQAEDRVRAFSTNGLPSDAEQAIAPTIARVQSEKYLVPASAIRNRYLSAASTAATDPNQLTRILIEYQDAYAQLGVSPSSEEARGLDSDILADFRRIAEQVRDCAWILSGGDPPWLPPTAENLSKAFHAEAAKSEYAKAIQWYERLKQEHPQSETTLAARGKYTDILYQWGISLAKAGQHSQAIEKFSEVTSSARFTPPGLSAGLRRIASTGILVWQAHTEMVVMAIVLMVCASIGALVFHNRPSARERRALAAVESISRSAERQPARARKGYARIIARLEGRDLVTRLGSVGRQALGRACLNDSVLALVHSHNRRDAEARFEKAQKYIHVERSDVAVHFVAAFLSNRDKSDDAFEWYISYLGLPTTKTDRTTARTVESILEECCQVQEGMGDKILAKKVRLNQLAGTVPGDAPCVVVVGGNSIGTQHRIEDRITIGSATDNDIVLVDEGVAQYHAVLRRSNGDLTIADAGSGTGTFLQGNRVQGDTPIVHGNEITCGTAALRCVTEPGSLGHELPWPHLNLGIAYFLQGHHEKARRALRYSCNLEAKRADVHWYTGCVELALENREAAFTALSTAVKLDPGHHRAHHALGTVLMDLAHDPDVSPSEETRTQRLSEAAHQIAKATELAPSNHEYFYDLARVHLASNRQEDALAAVQTAISLDGTTAKYRVLLARLAQRMGDRQLAREAGRKALELAPEDLEANAVYGDICFEASDYAETAERLDYVRQTELKAGATVWASGSRFFYRLGRSLFELGRYVPASVALDSAAGEMRDAVFYGARCHTRTGHFDSAVDIFQMVLDNFGEDPEARFYQASAHGHLGQYEAGVEVVGPIEADEVWGTRALCLSARLLAGSQKYEDAQSKLTQARKRTPDSPEVYMEEGRIAYVRGTYAQARTDFEAVLRLSPNDPEAHLWLGKSYYAEGSLEDGERYFREALNSCEKSQNGDRRTLSDAHDYLGRTTLRRHSPKEAIGHFEKSQALGNSSPRLSFDLALAYAEDSRYDRALAEFSSLAMADSTSHEVNLNVAAVSARMASQHIEGNRFAEAAPLLEQAMDLYQKEEEAGTAAEVRTALSEVFLRVGVEGVANGDPDEACRALARAKEITPLDRRGDFYLGAGLFRKKEFDRARELFASVTSDDPNYEESGMGVAFALEKAGNPAEADEAWQRLLRENRGNGKGQMRTRLGFAGYLSRQEKWREAAGHLHAVLDAPESQSHPLHDQLCRITVSYLGLAGDDAAVREVIQDHLTDASPESADFYLGAILAKQEDFDTACQHLAKVAKKRSVRGIDIRDARDLYGAVSLALAARQAMKGDFRAALSCLDDAHSSNGGTSRAARALRESLEAAVLLGSGAGDLTDATSKAYEKALKKDPNNKSLLRNYAVVAHKLAVMREQDGHVNKADEYWVLARKLWQQLAGPPPLKVKGKASASGDFWDAFAEEYNEGKKARDRLQSDDVAAIRSRVIDSCRDVNVAFAKAHLTARSVPNVKRHVSYALKWPHAKDYPDQLAGKLLAEARLALRDSQDNLSDFAEFLWDKVSKSDECKGLALQSHLERAIDALWGSQYREFQSRMRSVDRFADPKMGDLKELAKKAARVDVDFIRKVVDQTRMLLGILGARIGEPRSKQILFKVVLNMASVYDGLGTYERMAIDDAKLAEVIAKLIVEIAQRG